MRVVRIAAAAVEIAVLLAGCGSGGAGSSTPGARAAKRVVAEALVRLSGEPFAEHAVRTVRLVSLGLPASVARRLPGPTRTVVSLRVAGLDRFTGTFEPTTLPVAKVVAVGGKVYVGDARSYLRLNAVEADQYTLLTAFARLGGAITGARNLGSAQVHGRRIGRYRITLNRARARDFGVWTAGAQPNTPPARARITRATADVDIDRASGQVVRLTTTIDTSVPAPARPDSSGALGVRDSTDARFSRFGHPITVTPPHHTRPESDARSTAGFSRRVARACQVVGPTINETHARFVALGRSPGYRGR